MKESQTILYQSRAPHVVRIVLKLHGMLIDPSGLPPETRKAFGTRPGGPG